MARIPAPAVLGSGRGRSRVGSGGQLVNFYAEQAAEGADTAAWLNGCPGLSQFADTGSGYVRALYTFKGQAYAVTNDGLYRISGSGTSTRVAAISVSRAASIADNGLVMVIVDGNRGWAFNGTTVAAIGEDGFYGADNVIFFNQYFIFNRSGTGQFFWSEILAEFDGSSLDPLDFATAEYGPDKLVGIDTLQQQLWLFGEKSVEIWYASGDENTFLRIPGGVIDRGCAGSYAHTKTGDNVFWLSGEGIVYTNAGYQAQRVSTHSVEFDLKGRDLSSAQMWSYEDEGHTFVMLTLGAPLRTTGDQPEVQDAKRTWCFDTSTGVWHVRSHIDYGRHIANAYCRAYDRHLVGSFVDGKVYEMALEKYTDAGRPLVSEVWYSPLTNNRSRMFHSSFEVDGDWGWPLRPGAAGATTYTTHLVVAPGRYDISSNFNSYLVRTVGAGEGGASTPEELDTRILEGALFSPDGSQFVAMELDPDTSDRFIAVYTTSAAGAYVRTQSIIRDFSTSSLARMAFSPDGEYFVVGHSNVQSGDTVREFEVFETTGWTQVTSLEPTTAYNANTKFWPMFKSDGTLITAYLQTGSPTNTRILTLHTYAAGTFTFQSVATTSDPAMFSDGVPFRSVQDIALDPDGDYLVVVQGVAPNDDMIVVLNMVDLSRRAGQPVPTNGSGDGVYTVDYNPAGGSFAYIDRLGNTLNIVEDTGLTITQTEDVLGDTLGIGNDIRVRYAPDGSHVATYWLNGTTNVVWVHVFGTETWGETYANSWASLSLPGYPPALGRLVSGQTQGTSPTPFLAQISWSDDGGMTWSNQRIMGVGEVGERGYRFIARRLGQSRDRIYRFAMDGAHPHRISAVGFIEGTGE